MKNHLKSIINFFLTYLRSLNPVSYIELSERMHRHVFHYFFSLIFVAIVALSILSLPKLIFLQYYINNQFDKFQQLEVNINSQMHAPVFITDSEPLIAIDTSNNITDIHNLQVKLLITDKKIQFKPYFTKVYESNITGFSNLLQHRVDFKKIITYLIIIALPIILVILYTLFALKYLTIILVTIPIVFGMSRAFRSNIRFRSIIRIAFYAVTALVTLDTIAMTFGIGKFLYSVPFILGLDLYLIPLVAYAFYISVGIVLVSARELYSK